jgi:hypothetical protein
MALQIINDFKLNKMKIITNKGRCFLRSGIFSIAVLFGAAAIAQDTTVTVTDSIVAATEEAPPPKKIKAVKNTFSSIWIIDNQTVMVPVKGTFEMDIMHRFGTIKNGYEDFYGFFAPSNIRLGFSYVPINNLMVGLSITKTNMTWEAYAKYAILKQTPGKYPVSLTYFCDAAIDTRDKENFLHWSDRVMYFHQLIVARKITEKLSVQIAPSLSHMNIVNGYFKTVKTESTGPDSLKSVLADEMSHDHLAISFAGRYKLKTAMAIIVNVDQPLTKHVAGNPRPNISFGLELSTSSHAFQFFLGNYAYITPQRNNLFNKNDYTDGQFLIGFNITRLWNY